MDSIIAPQRVLVPHTIAAQMVDEARRTAPRECCGVLLGSRQRDLVTARLSAIGAPSFKPFGYPAYWGNAVRRPMYYSEIQAYGNCPR